MSGALISVFAGVVFGSVLAVAVYYLVIDEWLDRMVPRYKWSQARKRLVR